MKIWATIVAVALFGNFSIALWHHSFGEFLGWFCAFGFYLPHMVKEFTKE